MRRLIMLTILAGLLMAGYVFAESQKPPPPLRQGQPGQFDSAKHNAKQNITSDSNKTETQPSPVRNEEDSFHNEAKPAPCNNPKCSNQPWTVKDDPIVRYTLWLMIFTGILAASTIGLWLSTRATGRDIEKAVGIMSDTAQKQLRAYVFPKHDKPMFYNSDGYLTAQIKIKNFGQTPAYNLMSSLSIVMDKLPLISKSDQPYSPMASKVPLAPSEDLAQTISLSFRLDQIEIDNIRNGQVAIFVLLVIDYIDSFKNCHHTKICLYSTGQNFDTLTLAYYSEGSYEENKNS